MSSILIPVLLIFVTILFVLANVAFIQSGFTRKNELYIVGNRLLTTLNPFLRWFTLLIALWVGKTLIEKGRVPRTIFLAAFILLILTSLLLGERDIILQFLMSIGLLLFAFYRPPLLVVGLLASLGIILLPILSELKNIFTRIRDGELFVMQNQNLLVGILSSDFYAAGKNLDFIISTQSGRDLFYGQTLIWDLVRTITPGSLFKFTSTVRWFAETYYPAHLRAGFGKGFSLTAEGFINFGYLGVIIWSVIAALFLVFLYRQSSKGFLRFIFYIASAPFFVYAMRGDFSSLLSPILKQVLIPWLIILITAHWYWKQTRDLPTMSTTKHVKTSNTFNQKKGLPI